MASHTSEPMTEETSIGFTENREDTNYIQETSDDQQQQIFESTRLANIYIGTGAIGLIGNVLVVIIMMSSPSIRKKTTNMYIIHQSIIDALVSIALMGTARITPLGSYQGVLGHLNCFFWQTKIILWILLLCSTYNLVILTIERYMEIIFPIYHKLHFTKTKAVISLVSVWIFSLAFDLAGKMPTSYIKNDECYFLTRWPNYTARRAYGILVVIVKFFIPLLILIYCYGHIAFMLHRRIKTVPVTNVQAAAAANAAAANGASTAQTTAASSKASRLQKGKKNTIKTLALVGAAFVICWSCNQFYFLLFNIGYNLSLKNDFYHFSVIMVFINSCINPFIYVFKFEQFQVAAKRLFLKLFAKQGLNQVVPADASIKTVTSHH